MVEGLKKWNSWTKAACGDFFPIFVHQEPFDWWHTWAEPMCVPNSHFSKFSIRLILLEGHRQFPQLTQMAGNPSRKSPELSLDNKNLFFKGVLAPESPVTPFPIRGR